MTLSVSRGRQLDIRHARGAEVHEREPEPDKPTWRDQNRRAGESDAQVTEDRRAPSHESHDSKHHGGREEHGGVEVSEQLRPYVNRERPIAANGAERHDECAGP